MPCSKTSASTLGRAEKPRSILPLQVVNISRPVHHKKNAAYLPLHSSQHRQLVQQDIVKVLPDSEDVVLSHGVEVVTLSTLLLAHEMVHGQPHLLFVCVWREAFGWCNSCFKTGGACFFEEQYFSHSSKRRSPIWERMNSGSRRRSFGDGGSVDRSWRMMG